MYGEVGAIFFLRYCLWYSWVVRRKIFGKGFVRASFVWRFWNEIYEDPSPELLYLRIHATPEVLFSTIPGGHLLSRSALCFTQGLSGASSIYFLFGWHRCVAHHLPQIFHQSFSRGVQSLSPAAKLIGRGQASQSVLPEALVRYIPPTIESCSTLRSHPMG